MEGKRCAKNARTKGERVTGEFSPQLPPHPPPFAPSPLPIATVGWQYVTQCSSQYSGWQIFNEIVSKPYTPWDIPGKTSFSNCSWSLCIDSNKNYIKLWNFINCTLNFVFLYICVSFYKGLCIVQWECILSAMEKPFYTNKPTYNKRNISKKFQHKTKLT